LDRDKFDFILWLACLMLVAFWGLIIGILVSVYMGDGFTHHVIVMSRRVLLALGELYP
jgi:MFS superfamily sulfate permease-like transporter